MVRVEGDWTNGCGLAVAGIKGADGGCTKLTIFSLRGPQMHMVNMPFILTAVVDTSCLCWQELLLFATALCVRVTRICCDG